MGRGSKIAAVAAIILLLLFLSLFNGLFFMMFPSAFNAVSNLAAKFDHRLVCWDLHNGYKCEFDKIKPPEPTRAEALTSFDCKSDEDCLVTAGGGCTIKGVVEGTPNTDGHCVCAKGPVIYGCLLPNDPLLRQGQ